jgi:hypothetical protein
MIHTIIQIIAFQLFFLVIYDLFLKKETFFNWNRAYLLGTAILSLILPFIKIDVFKNALPQKYIFNFTNSSLNLETVVLDEITIGAEASKSVLTLENIFLIGATVATILFLIKLFNVLKLIRNNPKHKTHNVLLIALLNSNAAFSFFNYIFLGERIQPEEKESIISHELIHVRQKHSLDLLLFEVLRIVFWFNPLIYMYQNRVAVLHEFIADSKAVKHNKKQYYESLLAQVFETKSMSFINPFFKQSLIKKRIIMLQKSRSNQTKLLKYALLIPMVIGMLVYSSCSEETVPSEVVEQELTLTDKIKELKSSIEAKGELSEKEKHEIIEVYLSLLKEQSLNVPINQNIGLEIIEEEKRNNDFSEENEVPYSVVEKAPVFKGCENVSEAERKNCLNMNLSGFVAKNFNANLGKSLGLSGEQKISVFFKIDKDGRIIDIKSRAPHPDLETEAVRVINMLPTMIPGEHGGEKVIVPYFLPIKFKIGE